MTSVGVVIPAFHGAATLARSIGSLAAQRHAGRLDVVVAVNDGRADTLAEAARLAGGLRATRASCRVIRTARGRSAAINAAEALLPRGPRFYLDQDAVLSPGALAAVADRLAPGGGVHFAAPRVEFAGCPSRLSHAYYEVWRELPYVALSPVTVGVYAVSAEGRERWGRFPAVGSDDKWARLQFAPHERAVVNEVSYEVIVPTGARELVRARRGYLRANRELAAHEGVASRDLPRHRGALRCLAHSPRRWPSSAVFLGVYAAAAAAERGRARGDRAHAA
jgi:glycosyltransferase involved in cell wall biosynthesis